MHWIFNNFSGKVFWKIKIESTSKLCSKNLSIKCLIIIYNAYKAYLVAIKITTPDTALVASNLAISCWTRYSWSVTSYTGGQGIMWRSSRTDEDELWCNAQFHTMSKPVVPVPPTRPCLGWWVWMVVTRHCHRQELLLSHQWCHAAYIMLDTGRIETTPAVANMVARGGTSMSNYYNTTLRHDMNLNLK